MSQTDETLTVLSLRVDRTALVAHQTGTTLNTRHPVIGVWTNLLDYDQHLITSRDIPNGLPAYEVYDVEVATEDETQTAVRLLFRRPGSQYPNPESRVDDFNHVFEMVVPVQDLAVVQALRMSPEACFFALFDARHSDPSVKHKIALHDILIALTLPPLESVESDDISEKMTQIISETFSSPFSPISDEDEYEDGVPLSYRKAQAFLLSTLAGISFGDEVSLRRLLQMEEWYEQYYETASGNSEDTSTDDADQVAFVAAVIHLLRIVMMRSGSAAAAESEDEENPAISPLGSNDHDNEFMDIMKHLEIEGDLRRIGSESKQEGAEMIRFTSQAATVRKPFADGWPESMKKLQDFSELTERPALWEVDFSEENPEDPNVEDSDFAQVMTAFSLTIAARATRLAEILNQNHESEGVAHPTVPLVRWLTSNDDSYMWELVAMGPLIENYEILQFADLLNFSTDPQEDPHHALYFAVTVHTLAHQLIEEEWTSQSFSQALAQLDVQFADAKQVALHILDDLAQYVVEDDDSDDEDEPCAAAKATHSLSASGIALSHLSRAVAHLVPIMADVQANKNDLSVGDEEWKKFRQRYIKDLLTSVAETTSRNFVG